MCRVVGDAPGLELGIGGVRAAAKDAVAVAVGVDALEGRLLGRLHHAVAVAVGGAGADQLERAGVRVADLVVEAQAPLAVAGDDREPLRLLGPQVGKQRAVAGGVIRERRVRGNRAAQASPRTTTTRHDACNDLPVDPSESRASTVGTPAGPRNRG